MRINHNLSAMDALRNLNIASTAQGNASQKLSSGKRITSAADDAAGLAISQGMESQIQGLDQASRNSQDAISLLQTGEGALNETQSILKRMRDLSVEAASDTYTASDRVNIQSEVDQLKSEINRIGNTTTFNGKNLINGTASAITSTDKANTQVFVRGALSVGSGSYKLAITAQAGNAEIQKSNIFKISAGEVINGLTIASGSGVSSVDAGNLQYGNYSVTTTINNANGTAGIGVPVYGDTGLTGLSTTDVNGLRAGAYSVATVDAGAGIATSVVDMGNLYKQATAGAPTSIFNGSAVTMNTVAQTNNFSILAEVASISGNSVTYNLSWHANAATGAATSGTGTATIDLSAGGNFTIGGQQINIAAGTGAGNLTVGDKQVINVEAANAGSNGDSIAVTNAAGETYNAIVAGAAVDNKTTTLNFYSLDATTGKSYDSTIAATAAAAFADSTASATFTATRNSSAVTAGDFYKQNTTTPPASIFGGSALNVTATNDKNMSIMAEVINIDADGKHVTYQFSSHAMDTDGNVTDEIATQIVDLSSDTANIAINGVNFQLNQIANSSKLTVGDKQTFTVVADTNTGSGFSDTAVIKLGASDTLSNVALDSGTLNNATTNFKFYSVNTTDGKVYDGNVSLEVGALAAKAPAVTFTAEDGASKLATLTTKLSEIDKFTDASGASIMENPQTLQLIEGDGKRTTIQLYGSDTLQDVVNKLNTAIGTGLGQKDLLADPADVSHFASFVSDAEPSGTMSSAGTIVINSAKAGADGRISIVGDEKLINALGMSDMQAATETKFNVTVSDAYNPSNIIATNVSIQGNQLIGVVDKNVDVKFASNAGIDANWSDTTKKYGLTSSTTAYTTTVNLVSNTQVFQIGANEAQNMSAAIGDMRAAALGVDNILLTNQDSASKATTIIDEAIKKVSAQQSEFGALQNRLQHTINNLGVAGQNLTASLSQIQDVDMAQEMTDYSKDSILTQTANAMLAKANQSSQMVLQLLQG